MPLDIPTLFIVSTCIAGLLGLFLFFAWIQDRSVRALAWWGGAYLLGGLGVGLWMADAVVSPPLPYGFANALLFVACGMIWNGARLFYGRHVQPLALTGGAMIWMIACQFPQLTGSSSSRVILSSLIVSAYTFFSARELWRERRDRQRAKWAAILVPILHGLVFLPPIPLAFMRPAEQGASFISSGWMAVFALEALLYAMGTALVVLTMAKDRAEHIHKTAAVTDGLTNILNRRGFLEYAQALIEKQATLGKRVTVLMFDLDHFKAINDRFGHAIGDDTLRVFAATLQATLRASDVVGRLGGEEFAAVLPGAIADTSIAAERLRAAFETAGVKIGGQHIGATVSIGAACAQAAGADLQVLLRQADGALYRAKANGRNRIEAADERETLPPDLTRDEGMLVATPASS